MAVFTQSCSNMQAQTHACHGPLDASSYACIMKGLLYDVVHAASGVSDAAEAQAGIEFAKRFELIKGDESKRLRLQEVDLSNESSIAEALPRCISTHHILGAPRLQS